ncbi:hypothetical protein CABS01_15666 [Colletotrichum abscissum]|uniref:uncharacterized protein n=1 Tax=Colletotrichum abscissum TaxID=1671311 RepID=UPI0027D6F053|nr:uncharacterized protein CABS01_15666 [Colletotrichum abscissum]KAK1474900.1 hypothetical protein CABS01_15666 [Colletotrichum abscissum]KAK1705220.1 hypothetical protein BDP67DRAFT_494888 [Colletotrichum lupini]
MSPKFMPSSCWMLSFSFMLSTGWPWARPSRESERWLVPVASKFVDSVDVFSQSAASKTLDDEDSCELLRRPTTRRSNDDPWRHEQLGPLLEISVAIPPASKGRGSPPMYFGALGLKQKGENVAWDALMESRSTGPQGWAGQPPRIYSAE